LLHNPEVANEGCQKELKAGSDLSVWLIVRSDRFSGKVKPLCVWLNYAYNELAFAIPAKDNDVVLAFAQLELYEHSGVQGNNCAWGNRPALLRDGFFQ
jgi:hypothetical protein